MGRPTPDCLISPPKYKIYVGVESVEWDRFDRPRCHSRRHRSLRRVQVPTVTLFCIIIVSQRSKIDNTICMYLIPKFHRLSCCFRRKSRVFSTQKAVAKRHGLLVKFISFFLTCDGLSKAAERTPPLPQARALFCGCTTASDHPQQPSAACGCGCRKSARTASARGYSRG